MRAYLISNVGLDAVHFVFVHVEVNLLRQSADSILRAFMKLGIVTRTVNA